MRGIGIGPVQPANFRFWKHFSFTSRRVQNLAKGIQPAYLRLGGTAADLARFEPYPARQHSLRSRLGGKIAPEVPAAAINRDKINVTDCFSVEENTDQVVSFRRKMNYTIELNPIFSHFSFAKIWRVCTRRRTSPLAARIGSRSTNLLAKSGGSSYSTSMSF